MVRTEFISLPLLGLGLTAVAWAQAPGAPSAAERQMEAAARQRAASQAQTAPVPDGSFFTAGWATPAIVQPPSTPECPALPASDAEPMIAEAAARYKLNPDLLKAVIREESAFRPCAVSEKGAMGLMQLMPETAQSLKTADPFDPAQNIDSGARYLKQMLARFRGDLKLALAAYNAGPEKVDGAKVDGAKPSVPDIPETRGYVDRIVQSLNGAPAETAK